MVLHNPRPLSTLALAAALSAIAAPGASAIPAEQFAPGGRADANSIERAVPVRVVQVEADTGFDWGDAGVGASGLLALMAIGAGAAVATGYRPGARNHPQAS